MINFEKEKHKRLVNTPGWIEHHRMLLIQELIDDSNPPKINSLEEENAETSVTRFSQT